MVILVESKPSDENSGGFEPGRRKRDNSIENGEDEVSNLFESIHWQSLGEDFLNQVRF